MPPVLRAAGISKSFGHIAALRDVSLEIPAGSITALVGDNGAGKSTLVKIMSGVIQPDSGGLFVGERRVIFRDPLVARRNGIHTLFQDLALVDCLNAVENLFLGSEIHRHWGRVKLPWLDRDKMREEADQAIAQLRVTTLVDVTARIESLSGGQRQCVAIARSVRERASAVILDEPTAALGVAQSAEVLSLVRRLREAGTAVVLISHNLREIFAVADRVVVLRLGSVVAEFETSDTDEEEVVAAIVGAQTKAVGT